ncbi:uncharacterized protein LOC123261802 [Cotesia glomerata]|uniref:uncharacterized protein LOC123261802 n=1 Tax=Cotesia glomerata TaxID=32391 RepID=UPI001D013FF2|nr:uncharacterized protein LOC123261802 [Cotesia glomerata]XP_044579550.1 uncharacterized protein LOC123261802 [Cotesia glomerata]
MNKKGPGNVISGEYYRNLLPANDQENITSRPDDAPEYSDRTDENHNSDSESAEVDETPKRGLSNNTNVINRNNGLQNRRAKRLKRTVVNHPFPNPAIKLLKTAVMSLTNEVKKLSNINCPIIQARPTRCPNMDESIAIENGEEMTVIGDLKFSTSTLAGILMAKRMKLRARRIINEFWSKDEMKSLYIRKTSNHNEENRIVTQKEMTKIKNLCLYLQRKRDIKVIPGSEDDIDIYLPQWISSTLRDCRNNFKNKNK